MLQVRKDLCLGCGLCARNCSQQAISLIGGQAEIDQRRCNQCCLCVQVCPRAAIVELVPVSGVELQALVTSLQQEASDLIQRINSLAGQRK